MTSDIQWERDDPEPMDETITVSDASGRQWIVEPCPSDQSQRWMSAYADGAAYWRAWEDLAFPLKLAGYRTSRFSR